MTTNPFDSAFAMRPGAIGREGLAIYAAQLNEMNCSIAAGWDWFVNERAMPDGTIQAFLDRKG